MDSQNPFEIPWIANEGQKSPEILYYAKTFVGQVGITKNHDIVYSLGHEDNVSIFLTEIFLNKRVASLQDPIQTEPAKVKVSFFKGNSPANWAKSLETFKCIRFDQVWEGINVSLSAYQNNLEKEFIVMPFASVNEIQLLLKEASQAWITSNGELSFEIGHRAFSFTKPMAWQWIDGKRKEITIKYTLTNSSQGVHYGFRVDDYDPRHVLNIDPLISSTYIGGAQDDNALDFARDREGNIYVTGTTTSSDFPLAGNSFQIDQASADLFVAKISADLSTLIASTYLGGNQSDTGNSIQIDEEGNVYLVGTTKSPDFPITDNAFDDSINGVAAANTSDVVVVKLSADLSTLVSSTYLGGINDDAPRGLEIDQQNNLVIAGRTRSIDFPLAGNPYDDELIWNNRFKAFLTKMTPDLSALIASTYLGGNGSDDVDGMTLDQDGNIFVVGETYSEDFPIVGHVIDSFFDNTYSSRTDGFIVKLDSTLSNVLASTYIGGSGSEMIKDIVVDGKGSPIIGGYTFSVDYPTTVGAYREEYLANSSEEMVITKLTPSLDSICASTFLGGSEKDMIFDITTDIVDNIYINGITDSPDFPITFNAISTFKEEEDDIVIAMFDDELSELRSSTYFGGNRDEISGRMTVDSAGLILMVGNTSSTNFPITENRLSGTNNGKRETFISTLYLPVTPECTQLIYPVQGSNQAHLAIALKWHQVPYASGYKLSVRSHSGIFTELVDLDLGNQTTFQLESVPENDSIFINIYPYNELGQAAGCHTFFFTTDLVNFLEENTTEQRFVEVMPNPTTDQIRIQFDTQSLSQEEIHLELFDMNGKRHLEKHLFSNEMDTNFDLSTLKPGTYLLLVTIGQENQLKKILKF